MNADLLVGIVFALARLALLLWAHPLSMRYVNATPISIRHLLPSGAAATRRL